MGAYIARRLLLMIPTILGIMLLSFTVIQFAPGGPVEQIIAQLSGQAGGATDRISGSGGDAGQARPAIQRALTQRVLALGFSACDSCPSSSNS